MTSNPPGKMRIGVLGCGNASKRLVIPGILGSSKAELAAVSSKDPGKAKEFAKTFSCESAGAYDELLKRDDLDIIYVSLPIKHHFEWTMKALESGKHVYCEKSLTGSFEETRKIRELAKRRGKRFMEGFMFRFHGLYRKAKELTLSGEIGSLKSFVGSFGFQLPPTDALRRDPLMQMGILNESGCYTVCAARLFFGKLPEYVCAELEYKDGNDLSGSAYMKFDEGKSAYCEFGFDRSYRCSYDLWGTHGTLSADRAYTTPPDLEPVINLTTASGAASVKCPAENHFSKMIDAFCGAIKSGTGYDVFEEDAFDQSRLMEALRVSARENRSIYIKNIGA